MHQHLKWYSSLKASKEKGYTEDITLPGDNRKKKKKTRMCLVFPAESYKLIMVMSDSL